MQDECFGQRVDTQQGLSKVLETRLVLAWNFRVPYDIPRYSVPPATESVFGFLFVYPVYKPHLYIESSS